MTEKITSDFHTSFYIPAIQKLVFHLPHVRILFTNHCGEMRRTAFEQHALFQDGIFCRDYAERVVASFANPIQSEYYGGNISVYIEGIALEIFSTVPQEDINSSEISRQCHAVFHSFYMMTAKRMLTLLQHTENN